MWALRFEHVTKQYRTGAGYRSLRQEMTDRTDRPASRPALHNVSFEVEEGEAFAVIGPNGAGKSTALRIAARVTGPTSGCVRVRGRVGALIEVGAGIHPELTGRENIWLYGAILGLKRRDIAARFDAIVDFAELGDVLDRPVKRYSSGMQLRLGFSIAAGVEPDVLVVDEAHHFRNPSTKKSVDYYRRMAQGALKVFIPGGVFVQHHCGIKGRFS